jgi:hemolysin III
MIMLYTASTLYHWLDLSERGNLRLRKFDHMMIFFLIAATYTPFCLIPMRGPWGWGIFAAIWGMALLGVLFKTFWINAPRGLSTGLYLLMGWVAAVGIKALVESLSPAALFWVITGGICYTTGAIFYVMKRPASKVFGFHEIFHLFVLGGTAAHYLAVYAYF